MSIMQILFRQDNKLLQHWENVAACIAYFCMSRDQNVLVVNYHHTRMMCKGDTTCARDIAITGCQRTPYLAYWNSWLVYLQHSDDPCHFATWRVYQCCVWAGLCTLSRMHLVHLIQVQCELQWFIERWANLWRMLTQVLVLIQRTLFKFWNECILQIGMPFQFPHCFFTRCTIDKHACALKSPMQFIDRLVSSPDPWKESVRAPVFSFFNNTWFWWSCYADTISRSPCHLLVQNYTHVIHPSLLYELLVTWIQRADIQQCSW